MASLTDSALQARFNSGSFTGRRKDRAVGAKVAAEAHVDEDVGNYWKNVMRCDELTLIRNISNGARNEFYRRSTEWLEGTRVMPVDAFHQYAPIFRDMHHAWTGAVEDFLGKYDTLVQRERIRLKGMFDENDYPHKDDVRTKFSMDFRVFPFPDISTDWRVKLNQEEVAGVRAQMEKDFAEAQQSAVKDMLARIEQRMKHMHEIMADPDKRLFDSAVEHAKDLCQDLRVLNFMNDPVIEQLRNDMLLNLGGLNADILRASSGIPGGARDNAAENAKRIMDRVANMRGA